MSSGASASKPTYSIVIPVHDEQDSLPELITRLTQLLQKLDGSAEVLFVDDGSRDRSYALMVEANHRDPRFKVIRLSRNFGHQVALSAGLDHASGDAVVTMDGDLQHPPEVVLTMAERWREGYDVVYGVMSDPASYSRFKRWTAAGYYRILRRLAAVEVPLAAGDFRMVDRRAVDAFRAFTERSRYIRGMFSWIGFRQTAVDFTCSDRYAGRSKYTLGRMLKLAGDGITSFSDVPLRLSLYLGFAVSALSILFGISAIAVRIAGLGVPGWASLAVVMSFVGGIQLIVLGVMGLYVGRVFEEVKARPLYIVDEVHGLGRMPLAEAGSLTPQRPAEVADASPLLTDGS